MGARSGFSGLGHILGTRPRLGEPFSEPVSFFLLSVDNLNFQADVPSHVWYPAHKQYMEQRFHRAHCLGFVLPSKELAHLVDYNLLADTQEQLVKLRAENYNLKNQAMNPRKIISNIIESAKTFFKM